MRFETAYFKSDDAVLLNRGQSKLHLVFAVPTLVVTIGLLGHYLSESLQAREWLGGSSRPGLICGVVAGAIILFEMLLWPRKLLRRFRLFPMKYWMVAHIWLGLASLPLAIAHCGFHLGGWLPLTLMALFVLTIASGAYGLVMQNVLPRWMLHNIPAETIYEQIDYVSQRTVDDAKQVLLIACGRQNPHDDQLRAEPVMTASDQMIVVGAQREAGRTRGRTLETRRLADASADYKALWSGLNDIEPFLLHGRAVESPVTDRQQAAQWFARLRGVCGSESESIIDIFEDMCGQRRQFDTQQSVHRWLHNWIPVHIGLSVAVTILLLLHVWTAISYW